MIDCFPFTETIQQPGMDTSYGAATSSKKRKGGILQRMTSAKEELTCESSLLKSATWYVRQGQSFSASIS